MKSPDVRTVLWDIQAEKVAMLPDVFVMRRVLSYGGIFLISWLIRKYDRATVKHVFEGMKTTAISKRKYHYLKTYLFS
jgi:hypothetical protein